MTANLYLYFMPKRRKIPCCISTTQSHKLCSECYAYKEHKYFYVDTCKKSGFSTYCRECKSSIEKKKVIERHKITPPKIVKGVKKSATESEITRWKNIASKGDEYLKAYREQRKRYQQEYHAKNRLRMREVQKKYKNHKLQNNPVYKLRETLSSRVRFILIPYKNNSPKDKSLTTLEVLGAPVSVAKKHIEQRFVEGMSWQNHGNGEGKWHIDHIIPLASAKTITDIIKLCRYTNLQPLWSKDNLSKGAKMPDDITV